MQSLKSTAFAVTLLVVSFVLYSISADKNPQIEQDLLDAPTINLEEGLVNTGPVADLRSKFMPGADYEAGPHRQAMVPPPQALAAPPRSAPPRYELPLSPTLPPVRQASSSFSSNFKASPPPSISAPEVSLPELTLEPLTTKSNDTLPDLLPLDPPGSSSKPDVAVRQPVVPSPTARDNGLIDALKTDFSAKQIESQPAQQTFNSLASAVSADARDSSVSNAGFKLPAATPAQPAFAGPPTTPSQVWSRVDQLVAANQFRSALSLLSENYRSNQMEGPQRQKLLGWLDALTGKVIYSNEHNFATQPYAVQQGDTLAGIAGQWQVPAEVIYNINQQAFAGSTEVRPGMQLKMIQGPFNAEISLEEKVMTLYIKDLYAGRFPVAVGYSGNPQVGVYRVMAKSPQGYTWRDAAGKDIPAGHPDNGYGEFWIGMTGSLCIHAVADGTPHGHRGCLGLGTKDARDIYGILSKDSQVTIVR